MIEHVHYMNRYNFWACELVWKILSSIREPDFTKVSEGRCLRDITDHLIGAVILWMERLRGKSLTELPKPPANLTLAEYLHYWRGVEEEFHGYILQLKEDDAKESLTHKDLSGTSYSTSRGEILLHVFNHATYHRGQLMALTRPLGHTTVPTYLIVMLRGS